MAELTEGTNHCECTGCGEFFNSVTAFDKHQIWTRPDEAGNQAVRCLTPAQMRAKGWSKNAGGFWITKAWTERKSAA